MCCVARDHPGVILVIPQRCSISACITGYLSKLSIRDRFVWTGSRMHRLSALWCSPVFVLETGNGQCEILSSLLLTVFS